MKSGSELLEIRDLAIRYGQVQALSGVSLDVRESEILAVVGPNGAGKSSLLMAVSGSLKPAAGSISFAGQRIDGRSPEWITRQGINVVPEGRHIFRRLSVEENLRTVGVGSRAQRRQRIEGVYEYFPDLARFRARQGGLLSGGQQQQLAIGRALVTSPKLLLLDEPSLGLAPEIVRTVFDILPALRDSGVTVVVVEQRIHQTLAISDRLYVLSGGQVRLEASTDQPDVIHRITDAYFSPSSTIGAATP